MVGVRAGLLTLAVPDGEDLAGAFGDVDAVEARSEGAARLWEVGLLCGERPLPEDVEVVRDAPDLPPTYTSF